MQEKAEFDRVLTRLFHTLTGNAPPKDVKAAWWAACAGLSAELFEQAAARLIAETEQRTHPVPRQLLAYARQIQAPGPPLQAPKKPVSDRQNAREWLVDLQAMLEAAKRSGPITEAQRATWRQQMADLQAQEPRPPMSACAYSNCTRPGTISPSTCGGGPWYCREHA